MWGQPPFVRLRVSSRLSRSARASRDPIKPPSNATGAYFRSGAALSFRYEAENVPLLFFVRVPEIDWIEAANYYARAST
jgi:hypothetical protein